MRNSSSRAFASRARTRRTAIVPNFVTESGYTEDIESRNKVGDVQGRVRVALIGVADGAVKWVDHGQKIAAPRNRSRIERTNRAAEKKAPEEKDRDVTLLRPQWSEDGSRAS